MQTRQQRQVIAAACDRAMALGARVGMTLGDARAVLPTGVRIEAYRPEVIEPKLRAMAVWAHRLAPAVAVDPPDGLMMDVSGCERAFKTERRLLDGVGGRFAGLGVRTRTAIAPTFGAAWALARFGESGTIASQAHLSSLLAPLPTAALRLDERTVDDLTALGIERVEHLLALPRRALPVRFGPSVLLRLDQATGEAIETIDPVRPIDPPAIERCFDGPTPNLEAIAMAVRGLIASLCAQLRSQEAGATRLRLTLARSDLDPAVIAAQLSSPSREPGHLWSILWPKLERAHLGFGVEGVSITATRTRRIDHEQGLHWGQAQRDTIKARGELVDTLAARFGGDRVVRADPVASHTPERAFAWHSQLAEARSNADASEAPGTDRPTVLFDPPLEASVIAVYPDGPVARVATGGSEHRIDRCAGPERIGPEWWRGDRHGRDYFRVLDDRGRWLWVCREGDRWLVHGVWA